MIVNEAGQITDFGLYLAVTYLMPLIRGMMCDAHGVACPVWIPLWRIVIEAQRMMMEWR